MKYIIIGAGEVGRLLAATLRKENHDVTLVDSSEEELKTASTGLDIRTVEGSCSSVATLKKAGAKDADVVLAVGGDEAANIVACHIASKLGVPRTICRLYHQDVFSEEDDIRPESLGIQKVFSSPRESAAKISAVLDDKSLLERIRFSHKDAQMAVIEIQGDSKLSGYSVKSFPGSDILQTICFAAILRGPEMIIPHGDTMFVRGDKVYVAGKTENIDRFLQEEYPPEQRIMPRLIIAGSDETGCILAREAAEKGFEIRFIEPDKEVCERLLDELPNGTMMLNGDPTEKEVLEEAGAGSADVFVNVSQDDEANILSCILAKRLGTKKVISLTRKPEYDQIIPAMNMIDCNFNASIVSANTVLRLLESGTMRVDTILQRFDAKVSEFRVSSQSPLCRKTLGECKLPRSLVLALVFRGNEVISPCGNTILQPGDTAVAIVTDNGVRDSIPFFPQD